MFDLFSELILKHGGKISKTLCKRTTHLVWSNGMHKTLLKATELGIKIVTPLWLKICQEGAILVDDNDYQPRGLEEKLLDARINDITGKTNVKDKKRRLPINQQSLHETLMFKSKRKPLSTMNFNEDYSPEEVNKTIKAIEEEKFFQKEFAKDLKKMNQSM